MAGREEKERQTSSSRGGIIALLLTLVILVGGAALILTVDARHVRFYLVDEAEITVPYGVEFDDPGRRAVTVGRLFGVGKMELPVETEGEVDTNTLGTYELTYQTRLLFTEYRAKRIVHVADLTPPVINLQTVAGYTPSWFTGYEEEGFLAWDDVDGEVTDKVRWTVLPDRIEYRVKDSAGNEALAVRELSDIAPPEIKLKGAENMNISARIDFEDPGFTVTDADGADLSDLVKVEGKVTPYRAGSYELVYTLENPMGDVVSVTRTVVVEPVEVPETVQPDELTIYLTFDDGPGPYTEELLDILAAYNVKATFFVTCLNPEYEDMVGRAYREGHSIGVHSATHNYYQIYGSEQAYFDDFNAAQAMIYRQTGAYAQIFRFPGGSSNTVSNFNPGIMSRLSRSMQDMGYQYYDWNVTSGDAGETTSTNEIMENIIDGCAGKKYSIVLQHDIKDYSVAAVERVIIWGLRNGYTFRALDLTSPTAHHRIAN
jgi:peptidoglycan/xylan/chitin deacetylase (PgdA/CDA1 family)